MGNIITALNTLGNTGVVKENKSSRLAFFDNMQTPILSLILGMDSLGMKTPVGTQMVGIVSPTSSSDISWEEDALIAKTTTANETVNSSATDFDVTLGTIFRPNDLVLNQNTGEIFLVGAVTGNNLSSLIRGITALESGGGTAADTITSGDTLLILSNANEEGSEANASRFTSSSTKTAYCQITRLAYELTNTMLASETRGLGQDITDMAHPMDGAGTSQWDYQAAKQMVEMKKLIENSLLFSESGRITSTTTGTHPKRITNGIISKITTNSTDVGGALTETAFRNWINGVFAKGGNPERVLFASQRIVDALDIWQGNRTQVPIQPMGGFFVKQYMTSNGVLYVIPHYDMVAGTALALDMSRVHIRYTVGPDRGIVGPNWFRIRESIQNNSALSRKDEILCEWALQLLNENAHGYLHGVTA